MIAEERSNWLVVAIVGLTGVIMIGVFAFLGYSPLSSKIDAMSRKDSKIERTLEIVCGAHMEMVGRKAILCFDDNITPRDMFTNAAPSTVIMPPTSKTIPPIPLRRQESP